MRRIALAGSKEGCEAVEQALKSEGHAVLYINWAEFNLDVPSQHLDATILVSGQRTEYSEALLVKLAEVVGPPIIVLGENDEQSIVRFLMLGADAYVPRSTSRDVLFGYLEAIWRRKGQSASPIERD